MTDWIAELSPPEQATPACYAEKGATLRARFGRVPSPGCHPLVWPNRGYFHKALPRSAPQVVISRRQVHPLTPTPRLPRGYRAGRVVIETFDTDAVRSWLR